jgi:predicted PurR-regulated permease PerM
MWKDLPEVARGRAARVAIGLFLACAILWLGLQLLGLVRRVVEPHADILIPLLFGFALAYILGPLVDRLERWGVRRGLAILTLLVVAVLLVGGFFLLAVPALVQELSVLGERFPGWVEAVRTKLGPLVAWAEERYPNGYEEATARLQEAFQGFDWTIVLTPVVSGLKATLSNVGQFAASVVSWMLVPIIAIYLLNDLPQLRRGAISLVPPRRLPWVRERVGEVEEVLGGFVRGQLSVCLCLAVLYAAGLSIVGVPLALLIAAVAGIANLIPFLGLIVGIVPALLLTLLEHGLDWWRLVGVLLVFGIAQLLEGNVITPKLVGSKVGLHPVTAMIALLLFGKWFGFLGLLVALPITAVLKVFLSDAVRRYRASDAFREDAPDAPPPGEPPGDEPAAGSRPHDGTDAAQPDPAGDGPASEDIAPEAD